MKMYIRKIVEELTSKGIELYSEESGVLRYKAPKGTVTPDIKEVLRKYKNEIIDYLKDNVSQTFQNKIQQRYEKFPLTDIQNSYVMGRNNMYELGGVGCHGYLEIVFDEVLNIEMMENAWNKVIQKHDMLRAIVFDVGYQIVQESVPYVHIPCIDLRNDKEHSEEKKTQLRNNLSNKQYELGKWPMCDLAISLEDNRSILYFSLDMLIADFLSMNIILNDLEWYYRNPEEEINHPTLYRDIINYQNQLKTNHSKKYIEAEQYWNKKLVNMGESPELPFIRKHNLNSNSFYQKQIFLNKDQWMKLNTISRDYEVTPSMFVLSSLAEVIALWSSNKAFNINITYFNRPQLTEDINKIVGDFTDVDVLSINMDYQMSYINRIKKMQKDLWEDMEHNAISGVEVLRRLTKERKKNIIIPVVFTSTLGLAGESDATVKRKIQYKISQTPQVYIDCQASEENGGVKINWDVREGVFEKSVIDDMFEAFSELIYALISENSIILNENHPVILPEHVRHIRENVNSNNKQFKMQMLEEGFRNALMKYPQKTALITEEGEYTYETLSCYIQTLISSFEDNIREGELVAINLKKSVWQIAAVYAVLYSKGTYVPIDINQPIMRKRKIIQSAGIKIMFSDEPEPDLEDLVKNIVVNDLPVSKPMEHIHIEQNYDRPAYIIFTSGTTGDPKGVIISHKAAMNTILDMRERYNLNEEDIFLGLSNLSFDLSVFDIFGCYLVGGTLVLPDTSKTKDSKYLSDLILLKRITILNGVPAQIQLIINYMDSVVGARKNPFIRLVIMSGDWIPVNLPEKLYSLFNNVKVVSCGGATEAAIWSIAYDIKKEEVFHKSIPYGKPLANQRFYILDDKLQDCPNYVTGNIFIAGSGLAIGYLNDEVRTKEKFIILPDGDERLYKTGDIGYYKEDGNIIFQGRESGDEQVKIHGHRIELAEIRSALQEHPLINSTAVLATGEKTENRKIKAVVSPVKKSRNNSIIISGDEREFLAYVGDTFANSINGNLLKIWNEKSEKVVIADIYNVFKSYGIFLNLQDRFSFDEIINTIGIPEKLHKLTKRWLKVLCDEGVIEMSQGKYALATSELYLDSELSWREFYEIEKQFNYSQAFVDYLKKSSDLLPEMIQGKENPLNILFPKGDVGPAMAAYRDNKISQINNGLAIKEITYLCKKSNQQNPQRTFRILEVGAGVGGTTLDLIPSLDGFNVEYHFTDLSTFFLSKAQSNFKNYNWIKYDIFDINKNFFEQGYEAFSFDIILCANVLHNSQNIHKVMENLKGLLVDGGSIIILEETCMSYMLLTSMEFKDGLTGFSDEREDDDQTFFTREQWEKIISDHNGEIVYDFPPKGSKIDVSGQTVYVTRFANDYEDINKGAIKDFLRKRISEYMIPSDIVILPEIPLSENKKVDTKVIKRIFEEKEHNETLSENIKEMPATGLEKRIATIWQRELKLDMVGRYDNFYDIGGDSLLIAQIVGKIVEEIDEAKGWEWSSLLTEMMQTPTIADLATKIEKHYKEKDTFVDPSLIRIKESSQANSKSIAKVLFHAGTGTLSAYRELLSYIEEDSKDNEAVLGFSFGNEAEYMSIETKDTFKVLGKKYGKILQSLNYSGYILIGHCVGGLIALEAAEFLKNSNIKVSDVTLISATIQKSKNNTNFYALTDEMYNKALRTSLENELLLERTFSKLINVNEEKAGYTVKQDILEECIEWIVKEGNGEVSAESFCNLHGKYEKVGNEFRKLASRPLSERLNKLYTAIERNDSELMDHERKLLNTLFNIFSQNFGCVASHKPMPYYGKVRIFSCEQQGASFYRKFFGEDLETWRPYIKGEYEYDIISGEHFDCISGENLKENLSKILNFTYE